MTGDESARGDGQNLGAALCAPGLNLSDLVPIQQDSVTPAPAAKGSYRSARFQSQSRPYGLLYSHCEITFEFNVLQEGLENIRKLVKIVKNYFERLSSFFLDNAYLLFDNLRWIFRRSIDFSLCPTTQLQEQSADTD